MRIYYNLGSEDFEKEEFLEYLAKNSFVRRPGIIRSARILERKWLNKGNALDGHIELSSGLCTGLNIGGNPIGTGYQTFIPFLEEIGCEKIFGKYIVNSIIGKEIGLITNIREDRTAGYFFPKSMYELFTFDASETS